MALKTISLYDIDEKQLDKVKSCFKIEGVKFNLSKYIRYCLFDTEMIDQFMKDMKKGIKI